MLLTASQFLRAKQGAGGERREERGVGSRGVVEGLERLCREEGRGGEHLLLYVHLEQSSGAEVSGHIDLSHRLGQEGLIEEVGHSSYTFLR